MGAKSVLKNMVRTGIRLVSVAGAIGVPTVTAISPATGPTGGGTLVDITVSNSSGCTGAAVGGVSLTGFVIVNSTTVRGTTAGGMSVGLADVTVTNPLGTGTLDDGFDVINVPAPSISAVNYDQGDVAGGGADIVLTGSNFTGTTSVDFGGSAAVFVVDNDSQITCTLPAHAAGAISITVTNPGGSDTIGFTYWSPASLTSSFWARADGGTGFDVDGGGAGTFEDISGNARDATSAAGVTPTEGTAVEGHTPPQFIAANSDVMTIGSGRLISATGHRYWTAQLFKIASWVDNGTLHQNRPVFFNGNGGAIWMGMFARFDGVAGYNVIGQYHWDGGAKSATKPNAVTDTWYLAVGWYDGTNINLTVNGTAQTPTAAGSVAGWDNAGNILGRNLFFGTQYLDGTVLECLVTGNDAGTYTYGSTEAALYLKYCRQRYGLALT